MVQSTPPSEILNNDLIKEFAERCQSASRSIQGYINAEDPAPDNETLLHLIDTNDQLTLAMSKHQRAVLQARQAISGPTTTQLPPVTATYQPQPGAQQSLDPFRDDNSVPSQQLQAPLQPTGIEGNRPVSREAYGYGPTYGRTNVDEGSSPLAAQQYQAHSADPYHPGFNYPQQTQAGALPQHPTENQQPFDYSTRADHSLYYSNDSPTDYIRRDPSSTNANKPAMRGGAVGTGQAG